ncbi:MAG: fluoride efflux transporter CrcB [Campylobacterales bacterium]|nr:fluoride efflux transporter CrcB [Campylobacterales bacterium]
MLRELAIVGIGGAIGSIVRYLTVTVSAKLFFTNYTHYGTLAVNCIGSFFVTLFMVLYIEKFSFPDDTLRLLVVVGFLGGFTTFSAFSYESVAMLHAGEYKEALTYILLSVVLSISFAFGGFFTAKSFL